MVKLRQFAAIILTTTSLLATCLSQSSGARQDRGASSRTTASAGPATTTVDVKQVNNSEYIVGEADVLKISVWREPELSESVVVRPDGLITMPLIGDVKVSGMTPHQIEGQLTDRLKSLLVNPQVTVSVSDIRSKTVYITGEVVKPGGYPLLSPITVLQLIAKAGGLSEYADRQRIFILRERNGIRERLPFDYKKVLKGRNQSQDVLLQSGDTVVVP